MEEYYFGDKNVFGIRYVPGYYYSNNDIKYNYAYLHLILGGNIIGDPNEVCLIGTWIFYLRKHYNLIKNNFELLKNTEFKNRTDEEIFELIWKANGKKSKKFKYLPTLDESVWYSCHFSIDETTDAWLITITEDYERIKFIWKGWREPCPKNLIGKIKSITIERDLLLKIISDCISKVEQDITNYPKEK